MTLTGKCYCGEIQYQAAGEPMFRGQCHCRECQTISGGAPNLFMSMPKDGFSYTRGQPKSFARADLEQPVTREFCGTCGTHLTTRVQGLDAVILKVGTLDDPTQYGQAQLAIFTVDRQPFHTIPEGVPAFERMPPQG